MKRAMVRFDLRAGFTLLELVIVMAITSILAVIVSIPLIEWPRLYAAIQADREMAEQARSVIQWMGRDVREARAVLPSAGPYATSASETLVLARGTGPETRTVVWSASESGISRREFSGAGAADLKDQMFLALPPVSLRWEFDAAPPHTSCVDLTITLRRTVAESERVFSLPARFCLRGGER